MKIDILFLLAILRFCLIPAFGATSIYGTQSNDDQASSYAAGMQYDADTSRLYVTGVTWGTYFDPGTGRADKDDSNCFLGILQLPVREIDTKPVWVKRVSIGNPDVREACSSVFTTKSPTGRKIYLAGHSTLSPGILSSLQLDGKESNTTVYGFVLDLIWSGEAKGGYLLQSHMVQYPVAVVGSANSENLYVATLLSNSADVHPEYEAWLQTEEGSQPDSTTAGGYYHPRYGSNFSATLQQLRTVVDSNDLEKTQRSSFFARAPAANTSSAIEKTLESQWRQDMIKDGLSSLQISCLLLLSGGELVLAGSTGGAGANSSGQGTDAATSMDGFVDIIDPISGSITNSMKIQSTENGNDRILGLCRSSDIASSAFYVVGMTDGNLYPDGQSQPAVAVQERSYQAFIQKISAASLETEWTYQLGALQFDPVSTASPQVHGLACAVTPDDVSVYLAGTVKDGAVISIDGSTAASLSAGRDDLFVAQFQTGDGSLVFAEQIGTSQDDTLASGNGLVSDKEGNAILLGNTKGPFFRKKEPLDTKITNDVFVFSVERNTGTHFPIFEMGGSNEEDNRNSEGTNAGHNNTNDTTGSNDSDSEQPRSDGGEDPVSQATKPDEGKSRVGLVVAMIVLGITVMASVLVIVYLRGKKEKAKSIGGTYIGDADSNGIHPNRNSHALYMDSNAPLNMSRRTNNPYLNDAEEATFSSGITLRSMPGRGIEANKDTLLVLEPAILKRDQDDLLQPTQDPSDEYKDLLMRASEQLQTRVERSQPNEEILDSWVWRGEDYI